MLLRDYGTTGLMEERKIEKVSHQGIQPGMVAGADTGNGGIHHVYESAKHN